MFRCHRLFALCVLFTMFGCDSESASVKARAFAAAETTSKQDARAGWIRITPAGIGELPNVVGNLDRDALTFDVPQEKIGDLRICTNGRCKISLVPEKTKLSLSKTATELAVDVDVAVNTSAIPIRYEATWPCAFTGAPECAVVVNSTRAGNRSLSAQALFELGVDVRTGLAVLSTKASQVPHGLDGGDIAVAGTNKCGQLWCTAASVGPVQEALATQVNESLSDALEEHTKTASCRACAYGCNPGSACAKDGYCRRIAGVEKGSCDPSPLAASVSIASLDGSRRTYVSTAIADEAISRDGGIDLALRITAKPSKQHACVVKSQAPPMEAISAESLKKLPDGSAHVRVVIGKAAIERTLWAVQQSGIGCISVSSDDAGDVDLSLLLPATQRLAELGVVSPQISVQPLSAPDVELNSDGSFSLSAGKVRIDFSAKVAGHTLRLASATATLRAQAALALKEDGLVLSLPPEKVSSHVDSMWVAPILSSNASSVSTTFDVLLNLAKGSLKREYRVFESRLPGGLTLSSTPRAVTVDGQRMLAVDMRFGSRP